MTKVQSYTENLDSFSRLYFTKYSVVAQYIPLILKMLELVNFVGKCCVDMLLGLLG